MLDGPFVFGCRDGRRLLPAELIRQSIEAAALGRCGELAGWCGRWSGSQVSVKSRAAVREQVVRDLLVARVDRGNDSGSRGDGTAPEPRELLQVVRAYKLEDVDRDGLAVDLSLLRLEIQD